MLIAILAGNLLLLLALLVLVWGLRASTGKAIAVAIEPLGSRLDTVRSGLEARLFGNATDTAERLEKTAGGLRQQIADRLDGMFRLVRDTVETQLGSGRNEQAARLESAIGRLEAKFADLQTGTERRLEDSAEKLAQSLTLSRQENANSMQRTSEGLKADFAGLTQQTRESLEKIRGEVDAKLIAITDRVTDKLDQNIKEGFQQFEKVQQHLQAAQEELKNVGLLGNSVHELNNLLKLPHLRGRFGEASLERLLADFLPAHMYELQGAAGENGAGRADALIKFPERVLPIDAKFPREQILPLFETSDPAILAAAREDFARVIKEQARRIAAYIHPENGTTDMALMYLPSETLYMEAVTNGDLSEWLNKLRVFPVSPNTLIVTLQAIQMVFKMYEYAKGYERATLELKKAQTAFGHFEGQFENIGKSLGKAQESFEVASRHLNRYRNRVINLTGGDTPELPGLED